MKNYTTDEILEESSNDTCCYIGNTKNAGCNQWIFCYNKPVWGIYFNNSNSDILEVCDEHKYSLNVSKNAVYYKLEK